MPEYEILIRVADDRYFIIEAEDSDAAIGDALDALPPNDRELVIGTGIVANGEVEIEPAPLPPEVHTP